MANTKVTGDLIASSTIATGNIADNAVTSDKISGITTAHITEGANLYYTNARADARITAATTSDLSEGTNLYYTDARADARAALLVDSAPSTLNTLNELAAALGDDPNFATTVTNSIATKLPLAGGTLTGNLGIGGAASDGNLHVRKTGINTGITNVLMNANFADGSNGTGLSIGYRTDETTAVLAARTATGNIAFYSYDGGWSESMRIKNNGNVGIGVTPTKALQVNGEALFGNGTDGLLLSYSSGNSSGIIDTGFSATALEFRVGNTQELLINGASATFAGAITNVGSITTKATGASNSIVAQWQATNANNCATFRTTDSGHIFRIHAQNSGTIYVQNDDGSNYLKIADSGSNEILGNTTVTGTVFIDGVSNYTGLEVKGAGASRPQIKFSNVNQGVLGQIFGTEANSLVVTTPAGLEYKVRNANGASGDHVFKSYNTAILTLDGGTNNATFAGNVNVGGGFLGVIDPVSGNFSGEIKVGGAGSSRRLLLKQDTVLEYLIGAEGSASLLKFGTGTGATERMRIASSGEIIFGNSGTNNAGFLDFDGTSVQINTQRNPNSGAFVDTAKSNASINLVGPSGGSYIRFNTAAANNTTATERMRISPAGLVQIGASSVTNLSIGANGSDIELSAKKDGTDAIDMVFKTQASGGGLAEKMRIKSGGKTLIGITSEQNAGHLQMQSGTSENGGILDIAGGGWYRYYTRVCRNATSASAAGYWHIKTNIVVNTNVMFMAKFYGYIYGSAQILELTHAGYAYSGSNTVINQVTTNNGSDPNANSVIYSSSNGNKVTFRIAFGLSNNFSTYFAGVMMDIAFPNPTGQGHDFEIEAQSFSTSGSLY